MLIWPSYIPRAPWTVWLVVTAISDAAGLYGNKKQILIFSHNFHRALDPSCSHPGSSASSVHFWWRHPHLTGRPRRSPVHFLWQCSLHHPHTYPILCVITKYFWICSLPIIIARCLGRVAIISCLGYGNGRLSGLPASVLAVTQCRPRSCTILTAPLQLQIFQ